MPGDIFVEAFSRHKTGQAMAAHLSQPFDPSKHRPESLVTTRFALTGTACSYTCANTCSTSKHGPCRLALIPVQIRLGCLTRQGSLSTSTELLCILAE